MTTMRGMKSGSLAVVMMLLAAPLAAQDATQRDLPVGSISFIGGGSATTSTAGPLFGGAVLWDFTERFSVEGQGSWFRRGAGAEAFAANASVLVNLIPLGSKAVPYGVAGVGLYRAWFDLAHARMLGALQAQFGPGSQFCASPGSGGYMRGPGPGYGDCTPDGMNGYWGVGNMPEFYARRLGPLVVPPTGSWGTRTFTDPSLSFGGGVRLDLTPHLQVRPDARAIVVLDGSDTHTVGVFGVNLGYRF